MTGHPAVQLGVELLMAGDTKLHLKFYRHQAVHLFYFSVAVRTIDLSIDMGPVVEFYVIRYIVDPHPGDGGFGFPMPFLLHDLGMEGDDVLMAEETFADFGDPGIMRAVHKGMAEATVNLLHPGVNPMAEINRLLRPDGLIGVKIIKVYQSQKQEGHRPHRPYPSPGLFSLFQGAIHVLSPDPKPFLPLPDFS
jgi:hypothetical protein